MAKPMLKSNATQLDTETSQPKPTVSAAEMGARQREISVSEFFTKNRHLLGFDSARKGLLTCVKEAVDNALDASEEAGILPEVVVKLEVASNGDAPPPPSQASRFRITVIDYGPGIVRQQIPKIFPKCRTIPRSWRKLTRVRRLTSSVMPWAAHISWYLS